jgi:hypothetical protein
LIVYVSDLRPDLLDDTCNKLFMVMTKVRASGLKKLVIGGGADFSHASRFVVDLSSAKDTAGEVAEAIAAFRTMYPDIRVILIADREPAENPLFYRLFDMGVYDIVRDLGGDGLKKCLTVGMTKEDAEACGTEKPDAESETREAERTAAPPSARSDASDAPAAREKIKANKEFKKHRRFITVAVCAAEPHTGATHHALLTAKFLCGVGFKACYLEANERRNILCLARAYAVNANERKRLLQFEGVDMYFDFKLPDVIGAGYDFCVFDFGRFGEFEMSSFLTKDIKLVIGGAKPWEMPATGAAVKATEGCRDVRFIMNHAPPGDRRAIRELMSGRTVHFSEYAPYPFAFGANLDAYKDIFKDCLTVETAQTADGSARPLKKRFWTGRR